MSDRDAKIVEISEIAAPSQTTADEEAVAVAPVTDSEESIDEEAAPVDPQQMTAGQLYVVRTTKELLVFIGTFEVSELTQKMGRNRNDFLRFVDGVVRTEEVVYIKSYPAFLVQQLIASGKPVDSWTAQLLFNEFVGFEAESEDEESHPEAAEQASYRDKA